MNNFFLKKLKMMEKIIEGLKVIKNILREKKL